LITSRAVAALAIVDAPGDIHRQTAAIIALAATLIDFKRLSILSR